MVGLHQQTTVSGELIMARNAEIARQLDEHDEIHAPVPKSSRIWDPAPGHHGVGPSEVAEDPWACPSCQTLVDPNEVCACQQVSDGGSIDEVDPVEAAGELKIGLDPGLIAP